MNNSRKKEILSDYIQLKNKLDYLENRMFNVSAVDFSKEPGGTGTRRTIVDDIADRDYLRERIQIIYVAIHSIDNLTESLILDYMYIRGMSLTDISDKKYIPYSYSNLKRKYRDALNSINLDDYEGEIK